MATRTTVVVEAATRSISGQFQGAGICPRCGAKVVANSYTQGVECSAKCGFETDEQFN